MAAPLLMIPGPTEFHQSILDAMSQKGTSHVDPDFIQCFGQVIKQTRDVFLAPDGQPFVLAGSGTLGWDISAANFLAIGDLAVVINTGYFGDRYGECLEIYGATVKHIRATPGDVPTPQEIIASLKQNMNTKLVTISHVDTSTGVRVPLKETVAAIRSVLPDVLIAVDGVCALAGEELRMTEWDIDLYLTGSQKCIGVPPGLSVTVVRPRALHVYEQLVSKKLVPRSYYANVQRWMPVMNAYEENRPSYFATPAVNMIYALRVAYGLLLDNGGMEQRFEEHKQAAQNFRSALVSLGYQFVPVREEISAYTMSAVRYPSLKEGVTINDFRGECKKAGIICAGGLHADLKEKYFRVGHMGLSTRTPAHMQQAFLAVKTATQNCAKSQSRV